MIAYETHAEGVVLPVKASAGANACELRGAQAGQLKVAVSAAPEKGKANKAIHELLCAALGLKRAQLELIAGETSPRKKFLARGVTLEELRARVEAALADQ